MLRTTTNSSKSWPVPWGCDSFTKMPMTKAKAHKHTKAHGFDALDPEALVHPRTGGR